MSATDVDALRQILKRDLEKYANNVAKGTAQKIADELTLVTKNAIEDFYNQYNPEDPSLHNGRVYYYRNWNFREVYHRYYKKGTNVYNGGVRFSFPPDVYTGTLSDPMSVFVRVIYSGAHGIASRTHPNKVPTMSPSPMRLILNKRDEIVKNQQKYFQYGIALAQRDSYEYMKF